jgi:hypothetical protein
LGTMTEPAIVVQKAYDWALWIIPKVEKFPKSYRFSIGQSLITASIELLMNLVDATYQTRNAGSLGAAVREVNGIRYLVRQCGAGWQPAADCQSACPGMQTSFQSVFEPGVWKQPARPRAESASGPMSPASCTSLQRELEE